jgi:hypothetical protein
MRPSNSFTGSCRVNLHFTNTLPLKPKPHLYCEVHGCIGHRTIGRSDEVVRAYETMGLTGAWHVLDRIWSDGLALRPLHRPLSPSALAVRRLVHQGSVVKLLTHNGSIIGRLTGGNTDLQSTQYVLRDSVIGSSSPPSEHVASILATDILEILPWRLEA